MTSAAAKSRPPIVYVAPAVLGRSNAAAFLSISESMLDTLVAKGQAPKPRKISAGRSGWLVRDLQEWAEGLPVSDLLPPANCGYGRAGKVEHEAG